MRHGIGYRLTAAALAAAALLLTAGCSGSAEEESSVFVAVDMPTLQPIITPVPTPVQTPVSLVSEVSTPVPTRRPTPEPTAPPTPRATQRPPEPEEPDNGNAQGEASAYKATPNRNSYTSVSVSGAGGSVKDFSARVLNGSGTLDKSVFANGKITLVNFWSTT